MTEGISVVIIFLWVPPGPPSGRLSAALPQLCRREKAPREMSVARLSPISQGENNDWLFLWASLEKSPALLAGMGKDFLPMSQIIPTGNLQGCIFTAIHFAQAVRALETQKECEAVALEKKK